MSAATLGGLAAVARRASSGATRDLALMVAENALARARAAAAYVPPGGDPAAAVHGFAWALNAGATTFDAGVVLRAPGACGGSGDLTLVLPVTVTYDGANGVDVAVAYPPDPCSANARTTLHVAAVLPPPQYAPGTQLTRTIAPPAKM